MPEQLPWERWLELAAMMRTLWPTAPLPDETIREWYERGARTWDYTFTQAAIVFWLEESSYAPTFADIAGRRRALIDAAQRAEQAERRMQEREPTPAEREARLEARRRWARVWAAMADRDHGHAVRLEVERLIGGPETGWNGRGRLYDETITRWSQLEPVWGPGEAERVLGQLYLVIDQTIEAPAASGELVSAGAALAAWGLS